MAVTSLCYIHAEYICVKGGRGQNFSKKNILSENNFFAIDYQENTTLCLLQRKILGRNYLCTNNRCIIFIRFIILNYTVTFAKTCTLNILRKTIKQLLLPIVTPYGL